MGTPETSWGFDHPVHHPSGPTPPKPGRPALPPPRSRGAWRPSPHIRAGATAIGVTCFLKAPLIVLPFREALNAALFPGQRLRLPAVAAEARGAPGWCLCAPRIPNKESQYTCGFGRWLPEVYFVAFFLPFWIVLLVFEPFLFLCDRFHSVWGLCGELSTNYWEMGV